MADYVFRGTEKLVAYRNSLNVKVTNEQLAGAVGSDIDVIDLTNKGRTATSFVSSRFSQAGAEAVAALLGVSVANLQTNAGLEQVS